MEAREKKEINWVEEAVKWFMNEQDRLLEVWRLEQID